jgi:hypothetical protein
MKGKTLENIEEVVHSPHKHKPILPLESKSDEKHQEKEAKKEEAFLKEPTLEYEAHESEPPVKGKSFEHKKKSKKETPPAVHEEAGKSVFSVPPSSLHDITKTSHPAKEDEKSDKQEPKPSESAETAGADAARNAVLQAINTGGDGRTALPRMEGIGSTDVGLNLGHAAPPASSEPPPPQTPSPHIHIDDEGNVTFKDEPVVDTITPRPLRTSPSTTDDSSSQSTSPPPGPPPMMPPHLTPNPGVSS